MRICLLGAGGFIGSHLAEWLLDHSEATIVGTDINDEKVAALHGDPRFTYIHSDIRTDRETTRRLVREAHVVVELVAVASPKKYVEDPLGVFELDFMENLRVVEMCAEEGTKLVQLSTCEVYGRTWLSHVPPGAMDTEERAACDITMREDSTPLILGPTGVPRWIYAASKSMLDRVIHAYGEQRGLDYTIVRPFNFVGPRFDFLPSQRHDDSPRAFAHFVDALLHGTPMKLVDGGRALRCYTYIDDAVEALGRIILDERGVTSRQVFNIGNPDNEISVEGLAHLMRDIYRDTFWDGITPLPDIVSVHRDDFFGKGYEDCDRRVPDITKAQTLLGWEPRWALHNLVDATMRWFVEDYRSAQAAPAASAGSTSAPPVPATV